MGQMILVPMAAMVLTYLFTSNTCSINPLVPSRCREEQEALEQQIKHLKEQYDNISKSHAENVDKLGDITAKIEEARKVRQRWLIEQEQRKLLEKSRVEAIGMNHEENFNFAITGLTGSGKSTFANVVRNVTTDDPAYAPVCAGVQCTMAVQSYVFADDFKHLIIWDVPGGGTDEHPEATYFEDKCLDLFDSILLFYDGRWGEIDSLILRKASHYNILDRLAIVYSKTDLGVRNLMRENKRLKRWDAESKFREDVEFAFRVKSFEVLGPKASQIPLFFICAHSWEDQQQPRYDERHLLEFMFTLAAKRIPNEFGRALLNGL